jgi:hypothetical protein
VARLRIIFRIGRGRRAPVFSTTIDGNSSTNVRMMPLKERHSKGIRSGFGRHRRRFSVVRQMSDGRSQLSDSVAVAKSYAYTSQHTPNVRQPFMFHYSDCLADCVPLFTPSVRWRLWNDVFCCFYWSFCRLKSSGAKDLLFSDVFCSLYGSFVVPGY